MLGEVSVMISMVRVMVTWERNQRERMTSQGGGGGGGGAIRECRLMLKDPSGVGFDMRRG